MATIIVSKILEVAYTGIRRASAFMALGINAANDPSFKSIHLESLFQFRFLPNDLPEDQIREIKDNFSHWIIGNALRELDQSFSIFLDLLYDAAVHVTYRFGNQQVDLDPERMAEKYANSTNVGSKLVQLVTLINAEDSQGDFECLSLARNCLSHANGFIRERDCNEGRLLRLTWSGFDLEFKSEKSTRTFKAEEFTPFETDSETEVFIKRPQREKQFQIGSRIELSPHDLNEICWAYQEKAKYLAGKFQEYARKIGIRETGP